MQAFNLCSRGVSLLVSRRSRLTGKGPRLCEKLQSGVWTKTGREVHRAREIGSNAAGALASRRRGRLFRLAGLFVQRADQLPVHGLTSALAARADRKTSAPGTGESKDFDSRVSHRPWDALLLKLARALLAIL
jgi:hypothetical protein